MHSSVSSLLADPRIRRLQSVIADLHVVGGTVRDALLGIPSNDIDLACPLTPDQLASALSSVGIEHYATGLKHQTLTVVPVAGREHLEITSYRAAGMNPENRVSIGETIEQDLHYRDFTINAMAIEVSSGTLIDPLSGQRDLAAKCIKAVGAPATRFEEDPLRMMRMIRFACRLSFTIDSETLSAASRHADAISQVSIERVRDELSKILTSENPVRGIKLMNETGLLTAFLPEVAAYDGFEQNEFHKADLLTHTLEVVSKVPADLVSRLAALFHDVAKPHTLSIDEAGRRHFYKHEHVGAAVTASILERLKYPKQVSAAVSCLVKTHMRPLGAGAGGVRRLLRDTGEHFEHWRTLKLADATSCKINAHEIERQFAEFDAVLSEVQAEPDVSPLANLEISGTDLLNIGFKEGPAIGDVLEALHEEVLDDPKKNNRSYLLRAAQEALAKRQKR